MPSYGNVLPPVRWDLGQRSGDCFDRGDISCALQERAGGVGAGVQQREVRAAVEIVWSGAPGAISVQLQTADTDIDAAYVQEGAAITTVNAGM